MAKTIVGSFDTFEHATRVVDALEAMGVPHADLNLVANDAAGRLAAGRDPGGSASGDMSTTRTAGTAADVDRSDDTSVAAGAGKGAVAGGVIGGTAGLLAGLAGLALPGIGPLVAAGPIAAMLTGAGIGAVAGGLIGGLRQLGVSDADAEYYAEAVRRGGALVIVKTDDARATEIADTMRRQGAIDIEQRVASWRERGWSGFDDSAQPYTAEQLENERVVLRGTSHGVERRTDDADLRTGTMSGTPMAAAAAAGMAGTAGMAGIGGSTVPTPGSAGVLGGAGSTTGTPGSGTVGGSTVADSSSGGLRSADHPNLGSGPDRPGVDTRPDEHARTGRAGMTGAADDSPGASRSLTERASDAIERRIPGDSDGDGR